MKAVRWALLLGIIAAFLWEGGLAWYQAGRGYGSEGGSVLLKPDSYEDYVVDGENLEVWMMSGDAPYMILHQTSLSAASMWNFWSLWPER